jgi:hypothetical protein
MTEETIEVVEPAEEVTDEVADHDPENTEDGEIVEDDWHPDEDAPDE